MAQTQMYTPGRRPGNRQERKSGGKGGRILAFLILLVCAGLLGWWLLVPSGSARKDAAAQSLLQRSKQARTQWIEANRKLQDAQTRQEPTAKLEAELAAATDAWAAAERELQDKIAAGRTAWNQAQEQLKQNPASTALQAQIAAIEADLLKLGATPEPPPPPARFRQTPSNPRFGQPFDRSQAKVGDLNFPGGGGRKPTSSADATSGILVDLNSRKVLWEKNPDKSVPIASMVKMMTMLLAMEGLEAHPEWNLNTPIPVTRIATKVPRTGVIYLDVRETLPFSDYMKAIAVKSANDAAYQMAEFIGEGDADKFIARMNSRARELGMTGSKFISPCGLPDRERGNSLSTAADLVKLSEELLQYPTVMEYTSLQTAELKRDLVPGGKTLLTTTNKLVNPRWPGVDGLKTGYIDESGFCVTVSCLRNGRRLIAVVTGYKTANDRDRFCRQLLNWGYDRAQELEQGR